MEEEVLKTIKKGSRVKWKEGALKQVIVREWEYQEMDKGKIVLYDQHRKVVIKVKRAEIDWESVKKK
jgi:ribosomal protein L14